MTALTLSSDILKSPASRGQRKFCKNRPTRRADSQTVGETRPESIQRGRQREARAQREGRSIQRTRPNSIQRVSGDRKGLCSFIDLSRQEGRGSGDTGVAGDRAATVGKWLHNAVKEQDSRRAV